LPNQVAVFTVLLSGIVSAAASYIAARISQLQQERLATENYKSALISEIRSLHKHLVRYEAAFNERVMTGEVSVGQVLKVLLQPEDAIVFTTNASAIGLFDNRTALRVLRFYSDLRILHGHALILSEIHHASGARPAEGDIRHHEVMLRRARRRAHFLVRRLKRRSLLAVAGPILWRRLRRTLRIRPHPIV
jgi:hypothetical protein